MSDKIVEYIQGAPRDPDDRMRFFAWEIDEEAFDPEIDTWLIAVKPGDNALSLNIIEGYLTTGQLDLIIEALQKARKYIGD